MKLNILRAILIILLIILFVKIFNFSSQDGKTSGNLSREVTETITKNIKSIQKLEKNRKQQILDKIEHFIRKLAHFSLYMLSGILTMSLMSTYKISSKKRTIIALTIDVFYAISDEIHQIFIPGRTAMIQDVGIDTLGAVFGALIVIIIIKIYKNIKNIKLCKLSDKKC